MRSLCNTQSITGYLCRIGLLVGLIIGLAVSVGLKTKADAAPTDAQVDAYIGAANGWCSTTLPNATDVCPAIRRFVLVGNVAPETVCQTFCIALYPATPVRGAEVALVCIQWWTDIVAMSHDALLGHHRAAINQAVWSLVALLAANAVVELLLWWKQ